MVPARVRRLNERAFGLVELVLSLSLLAILSLLAAPSLIRYWRDAALRAAAEELAGAVAHGRLLAIASNTPVCLAVGGGEVRFDRASGGACSGVRVAAPGAQTIRLTGGARVSTGGPDVIFTPLGAATPAGSYSVTDPATGRVRRVVVAVSGRVSVQ